MDLNSTLDQSVSQAAQCMNLTVPQFTKQMSDYYVEPVLLIVFLAMTFLFLIIGLSIVEKKKKMHVDKLKLQLQQLVMIQHSVIQ